MNGAIAAILEAQQRAVDAEVASAGEAFRLAHRADHAGQASGGVLGRGEHARHVVLEAQHLLGARLLGDVATHAAIPGKAPVRREHRLAADAHVARRAVRHRSPHQQIVERLACLEGRAVLVPAALDLQAGFPAPRADQPLEEIGIAARHVAAFEAREAQIGVLLPVPVRRKIGECAEARLAFAHRALGIGSAEELAELGADRAERLPQALVGLAHAPRAEFEHRAHLARGADRENRRGSQPGLVGKLAPQLGGAAVAADVRDPQRLAGLPHGADQPFAGVELDAVRRLGEAPRVLVARHRPVRQAAQRPSLRLPEDRAVPAERVADRLERAAERLGRGAVRLRQAQRDRVVQLEQLLDALLLGDVAADAAIAGEAAARVEGRLAADADVAPPAVGQVAPHEDVAERRALFQQRAVRFPAALDLDAGVPALLAEDGLREVVVGVVAHLDAGEAQLGVLLPVPVGSEAEERRRRRGRGGPPRARALPG